MHQIIFLFNASRYAIAVTSPPFCLIGVESWARRERRVFFLKLADKRFTRVDSIPKSSISLAEAISLMS